MKHLIIFLNYCHSRLDNPVYRLFASESLARRNATLLFLLKPLEERELLHETAELRKNCESEDITFHICTNLLREEEGDNIVQTIRLIRRLFPSDVSRHYPTFVYAQMPQIRETSEETKKLVWRNLVAINNAISDFIECRLLSTVFLYNDNTQNSLAEFIFNICHSDLPFDKLSARLPVKQTELFGEEDESEEGTTSVDFPPVFGSFNTIGVKYPEYEIRAHVHYHYLYSALRNALPEVNETNNETCTKEVQHILSFVPLSTEKICLQEDSFINLSGIKETHWQSTKSFWEENVEIQMQGLSDVPRSDWPLKIRQRVDALYQSRFRDIGADYFFKLEDNKTSEYCKILNHIIHKKFVKAVREYPYSPEAQKTIVRGLVNVLQQKIMEIQQLKTETQGAIEKEEQVLLAIREQWKHIGIFSRMRGKDGENMSQYRQSLTRLMINRTLVPGCNFAVKLLNELIPEVSALLEQCEEIQNIFSDAIRQTETMTRDTDPSELLGIFGNKELAQAKVVIQSDTRNLLKEYQYILREIYGTTKVTDADDLLMRVRSTILDNADAYLTSHIDDCTIPEILGLSIVERISRGTSAIGGMNGFVDNLKRKVPMQITTKKSCQIANKFILIAPEMTEKIEGAEHLPSDDYTQIQLINVKYGLSLQDLDGFTGQRMFVEPSIF